MSRFVFAMTVLAVSTAGAAAQQRYDSALEKAAAAIVAGRMGEIRGGFAYDQLPEFVRPVDWRRAWSVETQPRSMASITEASLRSSNAF